MNPQRALIGWTALWANMIGLFAKRTNRTCFSVLWRVVIGHIVVFFEVCDEDYREPDGLTDKQKDAQGAQSSVTGRYTVRHRQNLAGSQKRLRLEVICAWQNLASDWSFHSSWCCMLQYCKSHSKTCANKHRHAWIDQATDPVLCLYGMNVQWLQKVTSCCHTHHCQELQKTDKHICIVNTRVGRVWK